MRWKTAVTISVVVIAGVLVLGHLLGQPVLFGYVTSDSMEPTIEEGDGFVTVPSVLAGSVEPGDIVVYDARELEDGGLVTHRVVETTDHGYITRGDANPFRDQDAGEPVVTDEQVVAKAVQLDGEVVTIPHLGTAIVELRTSHERLDAELVGTTLLLVGICLLTLALAFEGRGRGRETVRRVSRQNVVSVWAVVLVVVLLLGVVATVVMVYPAGTHEYGIVSVSDPSDEPGVIQHGEHEDIAHVIKNHGLLPMVVVLEPGSDDVSVRSEHTTVGVGETTEVAVTVTAPEETGSYHRHVTEHRYLAVLPPSLLASAHGYHPYAALLLVNLVIAAVAGSLLVALFGRDDLRLRSAGRQIPGSVRLRRRLEKIRKSLTRDKK